MQFLLHGDNLVASRQKLSQLIKEAKNQGIQDIIHLNGLTITLTELKQALESQSLFGTDKLVVIEKLFSRPRSQEKTQLIKFLITLTRSDPVSLIIWEAKEITKSNFNQFKNFESQLFKTPPAIFKFLDSLKPNNAKTLLTLLISINRVNPPELVFYMLSRRISQLIIAQDKQANQLLKGAPWQKTKLVNQAKSFSSQQLLNVHAQLLTIDESIKTGNNLLPLSSQLDLLLLKL